MGSQANKRDSFWGLRGKNCLVFHHSFSITPPRNNLRPLAEPSASWGPLVLQGLLVLGVHSARVGPVDTRRRRGSWGRLCRVAEQGTSWCFHVHLALENLLRPQV